MEAVPLVYAAACDPRFPVVCMDEQPKRLIGETRKPYVDSSGRKLVDHGYVRHGTCCVWMLTEPLGGWRDVRVSRRRTRVDWAQQVRALVDDPRSAEAERVTLVLDNLNTHSIASPQAAFKPAEATRVASRLRLVFTPARGSWLNIAGCGLGVLTRQCLSRRPDTLGEIQREAEAWRTARDATQTGVGWQYGVADARVRLERLYPKIEETWGTGKTQFHRFGANTCSMRGAALFGPQPLDPRGVRVVQRSLGSRRCFSRPQPPTPAPSLGDPRPRPILNKAITPVRATAP